MRGQRSKEKQVIQQEKHGQQCGLSDKLTGDPIETDFKKRSQNDVHGELSGELGCREEGVDWAPEVWLRRSGIKQGGSSRGRETRFPLFYFF